MNDSGLALDIADLTNCDREPIHVPGSIQPHGALLALDPRDMRITHAGGETERLFGASAVELLGVPAESVISDGHVARLRELLASNQPLNRPQLAFVLPAEDDGGCGGAPIDAVLHASDGVLVLEFERRRGPEPDNALALVQGMIRHVQQARTTQAFCDAVAAEVRTISGFERVMVYRFEPDGSGVVIAESAGPGLESFLGLHYPESDIPKQARALYLTNWIRVIPDARYAPAPILADARRGADPLDGRPLDLSQSVLRSVSPVHREYLANMGVVASMSLSIVLRGQLWGLIACHHGAPRYLPYHLREACELFAEMASSQLETKVSAEHFEARLRSTNIHEELLTRMGETEALVEGLLRSRPNLLDFIPADGVGLWVDGQFSGLGTTPRLDQIEPLVAWLNATAKDGIFHTDRLPFAYAPAHAFADVASGMLALSISKTPRDYVLWFRQEVIRTVTWAGDPGKPASEGASLTPRRSFAAWQEAIRLHASPWLATEVEAAHRLRLSVLEVVLRRMDKLSREREAARLRQEQLTQELDHRVEQWQAVARALKEEAARREVVEAELSQVLRRTVIDQEAERLRIARELHDTLGQSLTLLQLGLDNVARESPPTAEVQRRLRNLKDLAADVGREVDRLAWEIRPTALDDLGIQTAIRNLLETWSERSNIPFDLHLTLGDQRMSSEIETTLYRVLQEALTNVVRHAEASRVGVILGIAEQTVTLIIEDDGRGFAWDDTDANSRPAKRLGLVGIRERLSLVGGSLEIESAPGTGTTLFIRIPL